MGTSLHSCAEMHGPFQLSFVVVTVVGPSIGELDGVDMLQEEGEGFWEVSQSFPPFVSMPHC